MMTQSVMTQSGITQPAGLIYNSATAASSKGKLQAGGFDMMMESSLRLGQVSNQISPRAEETKPKTNESPDPSKELSDSTGNRDVEKTPDTKTEVAAGNETVNRSNERIRTKGKATAENPDDKELLEQVAGMLQAVRELVMEVLNLSEEDLDQLLKEQGMDSTDLLLEGNLQQLFLADQEVTNILDLLTDENLAASLQQLLNGAEEIKENVAVTLSDEQLKTLLLQAKNNSADEDEIVSTDFVDMDPSKKSLDEEKNVMGRSDDSEGLTGAGGITGKDNSAKTEEVSTDQKNTHSEQQRDENQEIKAEDQFQVFIDNLVGSTQRTETEFANNLVQATQLREIANQIIDKIRVTVQPGQTSMEMHLNPEELGRVKFSVQSKNGLMTAQFVVQNDIAKEAIEGQLHILRDTLNQQGIKVEAIEVTVNANAFEQNNNPNSSNQSEERKSDSGRKITMEEALNMTNLQEEEEIVQNAAELMGSQIDYTA